jgi:hypothetical protein
MVGFQGEGPLVFITHDESTFNVNDGKRKIWKMEGTNPLRSKGKGKSIMVSGFLTPGGPLKFPDNILDDELLQNPMWPRHPSTGHLSVKHLNFRNTVKTTTGMGNLWLNKLFELRFQFFDMLSLGTVVFGLLTMQ